MRRIGMDLIEKRRHGVLETTSMSEKAGAIEGDKTVLDRDLLSVLSECLSRLSLYLTDLLSS